jgi:hypothetical protein
LNLDLGFWSSYIKKTHKQCYSHDSETSCVKTDPNIPVEQDLIRRDTTMNSLAKDVETGQIISPPGEDGVADIKNKVNEFLSEFNNYFSEKIFNNYTSHIENLMNEKYKKHLEICNYYDSQIKEMEFLLVGK